MTISVKWFSVKRFSVKWLNPPEDDVITESYVTTESYMSLLEMTIDNITFGDYVTTCDDFILVKMSSSVVT
jgi:hypothetical protein